MGQAKAIHPYDRETPEHADRKNVGSTRERATIVGFTKKQRRDQKKQYIENRHQTQQEAKQQKKTVPAVVNILWTTPEGKQHPENNLISVSSSTNLASLQRQIQRRLEESAEGKRSDWKVTVSVVAADHQSTNTPETQTSESQVESV